MAGICAVIAGPARLPSDGFVWRLSGLYGAVFLAVGAKLPFLPLWLDWRGLTPAQISVVMAAPMFARIVMTPAVAFAADLHGDRRRALLVLAWLSLGLFVALAQAHAFGTILVLTLLVAIALTAIMPLAETLTMGGVRLRGLDYGRMRLWGSLTFIAASVGGGAAIGTFGPASAIWLMVVGAVATVVMAHALPRAERSGPDPASTPQAVWGGIRTLATSPSFLVFLIAVGCVNAAHAVFYTFGTLHWQAQGLTAGWSGGLWGIGVVAEIGLFAFSGAVVRRCGPVMLILAGAAAGIVRWTAMAFEPPLAGLMVLQVLHGATFGATHLGAVHYISAAFPSHVGGTAQALNASVAAGAMGGATLAAGALYASSGGRAYLAMAALCVAGLVAGLVLLRHGAPGERPEVGA